MSLENQQPSIEGALRSVARDQANVLPKRVLKTLYRAGYIQPRLPAPRGYELTEEGKQRLTGII